jgi:hypothetical protein
MLRLGDVEKKEVVAQRLQERVELARRCAWCLRFCVHGTWIKGRRASDEAALSAATHTICEDCLETLRRKGLTV